MLKYQSHEKYGELVLREKGKWEMVTGELADCGRCSFCGHISLNGYWIMNKEDKRTMMVGTSCVFVLCNLNKSQQKAIKYKEALKRNKEKYAKVAEYLKQTHNIRYPMVFRSNINNADEIATEIVYKIEQTTIVNPFWFEQYQKLTGKNLKELM